MILPLRGAPVDTNRRTKLRELLDPQVVVQRIEKMVGLDQVRLTRILVTMMSITYVMNSELSFQSETLRQRLRSACSFRSASAEAMLV